MNKTNIGIGVILFLLNLHICLGQNLRITNADERHFIESLAMKYPADFPVSISIAEYDAEKIKSFLSTKYNELNECERQLFYKFLKQYDQKKISSSPELLLDSAAIYTTSDRKRFLKYFYKNPHHAISIESDNLSMRVNPILHIEGGNASNYTNAVFTNTRGLRLDGYIDNKVYFSTHVLETQKGVLPQTQLFIDDFQAIPQNGLYKTYKSGVIKNLTGYDYLNAQGYVGLPISKSIALELGHGRHFIGNGYRSLLMSDFSNNYFYLRFNTKVWKLHYQNIFAELTPFSANFLGGDKLLDKKYMASHYLSFKPFSRMEVGVFESVIFSRSNQFELQYLNPIVFYRTIEHLLGSSDNALLGLNINYALNKSLLLYGQVMLDEFNLELFKQDGWWANKQGYQFGLKIQPDIIPGLLGRVEYNTVRPYTYAHNRPIDKSLSISSYSHYSQPLAHPLGSNFRELLFSLRYQSDKKIEGEVILASMRKGRDLNNKNYGGNVLKNNQTFVSEFGNKTLQGELNEILLINATIGYNLWPNYKLFVNTQMRNSTSANQLLNINHIYIGGGISVNFSNPQHIY
jgi:hypothetical protein